MAKKTSPTLQHRLEYVGFRAVTLIVNALPLGAASAIMGFVWQVLARFNHRHTKVLKHLREAFPEKDDAWITETAFKHWNNLGRTFAEGLCVQKLLRQQHRVSLKSQALIDKIAQDQRGAVLVSLHMGNWEVLAIPALQAGLSMAGIYQPASNTLVDSYIRQVREPLYPGGLRTKRNAGVNEIIGWVREGETICMMGDLRQPRGVMVPFFGQPTPSTPFPALIATKLNVPLIAARSRRTDGAHFEIEAIDIPLADMEELDDKVEQTTARIHAQFEAWIRDTPEQWMWGHRRR